MVGRKFKGRGAESISRKQPIVAEFATCAKREALGDTKTSRITLPGTAAVDP
jgi:hypothetical protein